MGSQFQSFALINIRKAVELESTTNKIPMYLELQGHIESSIGKKESALTSFRRAIKIIKDNPSLFTIDESEELEQRLNEAIENINSKSKT